MDILEHTQLLESIIPGEIVGAAIYKGKLPIWLKRAAEFYLIQIEDGFQICLILPKVGLGYEILVKVQKQAEKIFKCQALLIADNLNPKYRAVFTKNKVPFIYKKESIFAPELGVKITKLKQVKENFFEVGIVESPITPFELKILAGYLSNQIPLAKFNLDDFKEFLARKKYQCSKTKISSVLTSLVKRGFISVSGKGPHRQLQFNKKEDLWAAICKHKIKETNKVVHGYYQTDEDFVHANESALSNFSTLAPLDKAYYALTKKQYEIVKSNGKSVGDFGNPLFFYEIRKEDPKLFSISNSLNPIEVYFELRDHHDKRVQIAIQEMLKTINIEVKSNE